MYHAVKISEVDQHTHRFLWRDIECNRSPDIYVITSVSFGDKPAEAIASLALRKTADIYSEEYPLASQTIIKNMYMDDVIGSVINHEEADKLTSDVDQVLSKGGFKIKSWMKSRETNNTRDICIGPENERNSDSKVLGVLWNPQAEEFGFK